MKSTLSTLAALILLVLPALAQEAPPAPETPAPLAPKIVCPELVYDFGEMENTGVVEHNYVVRNEGDLSLEIRNVRASCGCTAVKPLDSVIPPGGESAIQARFDLRGRNGLQVKTITVQSNDPNTPTVNLQLRGTIVQVLRAEPSTLFFGRVGPDGPRVRPFAIVSGKGPFQVTGIQASQPDLVIEPVEPQPGEDDSIHRYQLVLPDSLPEGTINAQITIQTDVAERRELSIPVAAYIVAPPPPPAP